MPDDNKATDTNLTPPIPPMEPSISTPSPPPAPPAGQDQPTDTPPPAADSAAPPPPPIVEEQKEEGEVDIPPVVTTGEKPKGKVGKKVIATILGILFLVGGVSAGVILVQRQQEIRERAYDVYTPIYCRIVQRDSYAGALGYCDRSAPNTSGCTDKQEGTSCNIVSQCGGGIGTCVIIDGSLGANTECQCQPGGAPSLPTPTPTPRIPTSPPPGLSARCLNIRVFDTEWNELTGTNLSTLKAGDKVRLTVSGTTTSGVIDKCRFKINGAQRPEVSQKRPGTNEFYDEYTIPEGVTSFTINAQLHHTNSDIDWF